MSGFNTKERIDEYEITFYTENREDFEKVQNLCRELIGHAKPASSEGYCDTCKHNVGYPTSAVCQGCGEFNNYEKGGAK